MTAIKRYWWMLLLAAVGAVAVMASVINEGSEEIKQNIKLISHKNIYRVAILQENSFPEYEKMTSGAKAALASKGYREGENISFKILNGEGNADALEKQSRELINSNPDLIIAVGTEAAKAAAAGTKVVPVVGIGVFRLESDEAFKDHYNLTGIGDMPAVLNQIRMASKVFPIETLGVIFNPDDEESIFQLQILREAGMRKGLKLFEVAFDEKKDLEEQIKKFKGNVSAVYIPSDEKIQNSFEKIVKILLQSGIPVIGENTEMVRHGALLSISAEYYRMGFSGGRMAAELLEGKKKPYEIPITKQMDPEWVVNMSVAKALKKELPNDIWQKARKLYLYDGQKARP